MEDLLQTLSQSNIGQIALLVLVLGIVWIVLRSVMRLATKILFTGCGLILLLGAILVLARMFGG